MTITQDVASENQLERRDRHFDYQSSIEVCNESARGAQLDLARGRLTKLVERFPIWPERDSERLRGLRAVSVLGQIGDADARKVLDALANGAPSARFTQEAKVALKRLTERPEMPR